MIRSFLHPLLLLLLGILRISAKAAGGRIDRQRIVRLFNPHRNATPTGNTATPMQVGNGNFAYGADVTGMQTFYPFNTLSSWCWHNSSLPTGTDPSDFTGLDYYTHGRLVNYDIPNPAEAAISDWLIRNPQRVNLGRVGLSFGRLNVTEDDLVGKAQYLDLYTGIIHSAFEVDGRAVSVKTVADPESSTVAFEIESDALNDGSLGVFFDYPYMTGANKFEDPFVGNWTTPGNHTTTLSSGSSSAVITHTEESLTYYTTIRWSGEASVTRLNATAHRYTLIAQHAKQLSLTVSYSPTVPNTSMDDVTSIVHSSQAWWRQYWQNGNFVDLTTTGNASAIELQRRIILSSYLLAVNSAGYWFPQESGLTDNGWYGKFHLEMHIFHSMQFLWWGHKDLLMRSFSHLYQNFLPSSYQRAARQGYKGARWGKMSDPTGRSAPGGINALLIWQQPHVLQFAEYVYRADRDPAERRATLEKYEEVITATADFMASYAWWNSTTRRYDLGPPMYTVGESTSENITVNPAFELAYWKFGLGLASQWLQRLDKPIPTAWTHVQENLAPLPIVDGAYAIYEGALDAWTNDDLTEDHPATLAINGWLPGPHIPRLNYSSEVFEKTVNLTYQTWNFTFSYGWDFPLLAMTCVRTDRVEQAVDWLLYPGFDFDDVGMPLGGARVATPYFPGAGSLLMAVAMMAGGFDSDSGRVLRFPESWKAVVEGFQPLM